MKKFILLFFITIFSATPVFAKNINIEYNNGIYHIILSGNRIKKKIQFVASDKLISNREAHKIYKSILTINTGFFDPNNSKTISYIITNGKITADPEFNENLLFNPVLNRNLDKILNRTEFRIIKCGRKYKYQIAPHKTDVEEGCKIAASAQGGPVILPDLKLEDEFFIVKNEEGRITRESASVLHQVARTIIGIKNNELHILIITDKKPMDMYEVQKLCKRLGFEQAMGFDGGSSTSMNYKKNIEVISIIGDGGGRLLKSFMIIQK